MIISINTNITRIELLAMAVYQTAVAEAVTKLMGAEPGEVAATIDTIANTSDTDESIDVPFLKGRLRITNAADGSMNQIIEMDIANEFVVEYFAALTAIAQWLGTFPKEALGTLMEMTKA